MTYAQDNCPVRDSTCSSLCKKKCRTASPYIPHKPSTQDELEREIVRLDGFIHRISLFRGTFNSIHRCLVLISRILKEQSKRPD